MLLSIKLPNNKPHYFHILFTLILPGLAARAHNREFDLHLFTSLVVHDQHDLRLIPGVLVKVSLVYIWQNPL